MILYSKWRMHTRQPFMYAWIGADQFQLNFEVSFIFEMCFAFVDIYFLSFPIFFPNLYDFCENQCKFIETHSWRKQMVDSVRIVDADQFCQHDCIFFLPISRGNRCWITFLRVLFYRAYLRLTSSYARSYHSGHYRNECTVLPRRHHELNCVWVDVKHRHTAFEGSMRVSFFFGLSNCFFPIQKNHKFIKIERIK